MSRYSLLSSISNRLAGLVLSVGLLALVCWLMAAAGGARTYATYARVLASPPMKLLFGLLFVCFAYHLCAGIRHLLWDSGRALEREQSRRSAWLVLAATVILSAAAGYWALTGSR